MGCVHPKPRVSDASSTQQSDHNHTRPQPEDNVTSEDIQDRKFIKELEQDMQNTPDMFLLNNVLFSLQFFENYVSEMGNKHTQSPSEDNDESTKLFRDLNTTCVKPDSVLEIISKHVGYRHLHGEFKNQRETLSSQRIYLVNDLIDVEIDPDVDYAVLDAMYTFETEKTRQEGYIRLRYKEREGANRPKSVLTEPQAGPSSLLDEDYSLITELRTPQPIKISEDMHRQSSLPGFCFYNKRCENEDIDKLDTSNVTDEDLYVYNMYFSSRGYMKYFRSSMFPTHLAQCLNLDKDRVKDCKWIPGKLMVFEERNGTKINYDVVPAVPINWSQEYQHRFQYRTSRPTRTNGQTGEKYCWPSLRTIQKISELKAVAIPKGYFPKTGENEDKDIEWEVCFPKAEQLLQREMSYAQIRCYLILLTIHKHYIEPKTGQQGLLADHIRHHMFWEMENNYNDWMEIKLGHKIIEVIRNLVERLQKRNLPDFFIDRKNLFVNIPNKYLDRAHEAFHYVLQRPLLKMLVVSRHFSYRENFYVFPDFKELTKLQTPKVIEMKGKPQNNLLTATMDKAMRYKVLKAAAEKRKKQENLIEKKKEEEAEAEKRPSTDSLEENWKIVKHYDTRQKLDILNYFMELSIRIVERSHRNANSYQTIFYCKYVHYLRNMMRSVSRTMEDSPLYPYMKEEVHNRLQQLEMDAKEELKRKNKPKPPSLGLIPQGTPRSHGKPMRPQISVAIADIENDGGTPSPIQTPTRNVQFLNS